jgi:hypothetical protein
LIPNQPNVQLLLFPNPHKYNQTPTSNIKSETIPKPK